MSYTITQKGTVTLPVELRRKLGLTRGSHVRFVETSEGVVIVPIIPFEKLEGIDRNRKKLVYKIIKEIHKERKREALEQIG